MLLLFGLLAGLLGMHGLGPGGAVGAQGHASPAHHSHAVSGHAHAGTTGDEFVCHGDDGGGGHAQHADATCASGAVGAGPVLPVPVLGAGAPVAAVDSPAGAFTASEGGRAPPSLAELQLLRI